MDYYLINLGGLHFSAHGIFATVGIIVGIIIANLLAKRKGLAVPVTDILLFSTIVGLIGARLAYYFVYRDQFESISEIYSLWSGGFISFGGIIAGGLAFFLISKKLKIDHYRFLDIVTVAFFAGFTIGRIGELFSDELNGKSLTSGILANVLPYPVVPIPLFEGIWCFILFALGMMMLKIKQKGIIFASLIGLYSLGRFVIDYWRDDEVIFLNLTLGRLSSIAIFVFSVILILVFLKKERNVV